MLKLQLFVLSVEIHGSIDVTYTFTDNYFTNVHCLELINVNKHDPLFDLFQGLG